MNKHLFSTTFIIISSFLSLQGKMVESVKEFDAILAGPQANLIRFCAPHCSVCRNVSQPLEEVSKEEEFKNVGFFTVCMKEDMGKSIAQRYNVLAIPTFLYVKNGKVLDTVTGVKNIKLFKDEVRTKLRSLFGAQASTPASVTVENEQSSQSASKTFIGSITSTISSLFTFVIDTIKQIFEYIINFFKKLFKIN